MTLVVNTTSALVATYIYLEALSHPHRHDEAYDKKKKTFLFKTYLDQ